jgi:hypothetical protein
MQRNIMPIAGMVTLAFDSTAIIPGMQYDEKTGNLVGIKSKYGEYCVPVENYRQIMATFHEKQSTATEIQLFLLNPIVQGYSSFIVAAFPSDKTDTAETLIERLQQLESLCDKNKLHVIGHGCDAEPKQLKAQKLRWSSILDGERNDKFVVKIGDIEILFPSRRILDVNFPTFEFQDFVHVGTKCRNNGLSKRGLQLCGCSITFNTLWILVEDDGQRFELNVHKTDLNPDDRMNFPSVERLCHPSIQAAVLQKGDVALYIYLIYYAVFAFIDTDKPILERVKWLSFTAYLAYYWKYTEVSKKETHYLSVQLHNL